MPTSPFPLDTLSAHRDFSMPLTSLRRSVDEHAFHGANPFLITRNASKQTYFTIRLFVDRGRTLNAYRAYAYFRWVDDWLDQTDAASDERLRFALRQQHLMDCLYAGRELHNLTLEERMLADLVRTDDEQNSGLRAYLCNMMAVMIFDAKRRGRLITQQELDTYTDWLSAGVTEAMHYFIGHDEVTPSDDTRYLAVKAAHITHLLRDTCEDVEAGYFNIPQEYLETHGISANAINSKPYRAWVEERVRLARNYFKAGRAYLAQLKTTRCRLAGYAYMARFESVLDTIEREGYQLRASYPERKQLPTGVKMLGSVLSMAIRGTR
jgi:phytoene/squalene synthetase